MLALAVYALAGLSIGWLLREMDAELSVCYPWWIYACAGAAWPLTVACLWVVEVFGD